MAVTRSLRSRTIGAAALLLVVSIVYVVGSTAPASAAVTSADSKTKRILTNLVCEGQTVTGGCGICPSFTGMAGEDPLGEVANLTKFHIGSFVTSEATEAYIPLVGCEPHSYNYQGAVLLRKLNDRWKFVRYDAGVEAFTCTPFRYRTGADLLVCNGAWVGQGYLVSYVNATYIGPTTTNQIPIVRAQSNEGTCDDIADDAKITGFRRVSAQKRQGLEVTITEAHGKRTEGTDECPEGNAGRTVTHQVSFTFSGTVFTPTPGSVATVRCLGLFVDGNGRSGTYCPKAS
jgi:hypothetical protein